MMIRREKEGTEEADEGRKGSFSFQEHRIQINDNKQKKTELLQLKAGKQKLWREHTSKR